jgi:hypothetical protein
MPARRSIAGVSTTGDPKQLNAAKPASSHTMYTTLAEPSGAWGGRYGAQSGSESRTSRLVTPLNPAGT